MQLDGVTITEAGPISVIAWPLGPARVLTFAPTFVVLVSLMLLQPTAFEGIAAMLTFCVLVGSAPNRPL